MILIFKTLIQIKFNNLTKMKNHIPSMVVAIVAARNIKMGNL